MTPTTCPLCSSPVTIGGDNAEGTHYYVPTPAAPALHDARAMAGRLRAWAADVEALLVITSVAAPVAAEVFGAEQAVADMLAIADQLHTEEGLTCRCTPSTEHSRSRPTSPTEW